ncbi:DNA-directed RNA polymerase sigma-70 factor [Actinocatenispora thailandica]|uniref:DNA-directed RNA polymerase sigma-70 factor n=1 Tax=Actinocatenispora thailandica TaxID=227318 RepID=A0A7R7HUI9_9ACTN|nr:RNA polymerase sigma factor [Actinocatenispora thailandica]BCJ32992.1 DNA-directed RNA polymerase sigma-70 factor [Actinocatenispora thailandica]
MTVGAADTSSDVELAARLRDDPAQFAAVYDRYFRVIYRYIAGRLGSQHADDLAAETFLVAYAKRDRFDPARGELRPWLFGIATNVVRQHRRVEARRYRALARTPAESVAEGPEDRAVDVAAAQLRRPQLARALRSLSAGERDVLLLVTLGQLSYGEAGEALGIAPGTAGSRLSRARTKLRSALNQETRHG